MIEKITREFISSAKESDYKDDKALIFTYLSNLKRTVNQLVDVINAITIDVDGSAKVNKTDQNINFAQPEVKENVPDKFAEQRKWIGSLVEYKLGDLFLYGILTDIKDGYTLPFVIDGASYTDDCWLPDESVIYHKTKGGDNE